MSFFRVKDLKVTDTFSRQKKSALHRYPLLFALLAAFGLVITNDGIQGLITKLGWLNRNPVVTLIIGLIILLFTGTLYKKL
jgi:TRAP-type C4-dicarboxylate transport system permease large subunit